MERRGVVDVVRAGLRVEHGEAVVMLRRDHDVLHARILGHLHPCVGVELHRIELRGQLLVVGHRNLAAVHDPLADAADLFAVPGSGGHGVEPPVDEHAEPRLAPPGHPLVALLLGLRGQAVGLRGGQQLGDEHSRMTTAAIENAAERFGCRHGFLLVLTVAGRRSIASLCASSTGCNRRCIGVAYHCPELAIRNRRRLLRESQVDICQARRLADRLSVKGQVTPVRRVSHGFVAVRWRFVDTINWVKYNAGMDADAESPPFRGGSTERTIGKITRRGDLTAAACRGLVL